MSEKKDNKKERADKYEEKVTFDGTFEDMIGISVKDAEKRIEENRKSMKIESSNKDNSALAISAIGIANEDNRFTDEGKYVIAFSMKGGGKKYWEYYSKDERDVELERIKKELNQ